MNQNFSKDIHGKIPEAPHWGTPSEVSKRISWKCRRVHGEILERISPLKNIKWIYICKFVGNVWKYSWKIRNSLENLRMSWHRISCNNSFWNHWWNSCKNFWRNRSNFWVRSFAIAILQLILEILKEFLRHFIILSWKNYWRNS